MTHDIPTRRATLTDKSPANSMGATQRCLIARS
jgi:hypothetical protein